MDILDCFIANHHYYSGIGSRDTPDDILQLFTMIAQQLNDHYILRTGDAIGADRAFAYGATNVCQYSARDIIDDRYHNREQAIAISRALHPNWPRTNEYSCALLARNVYVVLGDDLMTKSRFVICWTRDCQVVGGTGHTIRIARHYQIPVFNLADNKVRCAFEQEIECDNVNALIEWLQQVN